MPSLRERLEQRLVKEAARRNSAYDYYGMDNTPQSVDPDVYATLAVLAAAEAWAQQQRHARVVIQNGMAQYEAIMQADDALLALLPPPDAKET